MFGLVVANKPYLINTLRLALKSLGKFLFYPEANNSLDDLYKL